MTVAQLLTPLVDSPVSSYETVGRHPLNFYESPSWFTTELLRHVKLFGVIGEPCVGHGAISSLLKAWLCTNDIDANKPADYHLDATLSQSWDSFPECDWICTNPPYSEFAAPIIKNAYQKARVGVAAFLLTSFLEPCDDRADFLQQYPPSLVLILPRFCFRKDKRGTRWATDNITISCLIWDKRATTQRIIVRLKSQIVGFYKNPEQAISQERAEEIVRAIAIPGVNAGYRTPHDEYGNAIGKLFLIPDLKHFATQGRQVNICFDQDNKPETVQRVRTTISRMGRLLVNEGCSLRVIDLPFGQEKGVDDFIVAKGQSAFDALYNTAVELQLWEIKLFTLLTYPPSIALNQRFLGQLLVPEGEKLIILKAPKSTGKTEWLATEVAKAHDQGRRVLIITHRIQLGEALCNRFGVNYVTEVYTSETGTLLGYGVCVDSLHHESQARFNPNDWANDVIIIDECDQVFWHLLNSGTEVQKRRVSVLKNLKQLVQNVLGSSQGKIYLSSADVSDTDVKYVLSLAGEYRVNPFVIVNNYRDSAGNCYNYIWH